MRTEERQATTSSEILVEHGRDRHVVQFYDSDDFLCDRVARFLDAGFAHDDVLLVIATVDHREALRQRLAAGGRDVAAAGRAGQLHFLDAAETLTQIMSGDMPDWELFHRVLGGIIDRCCAGRRRSVRAYGEMVDVLWKSGNTRGAVRLEQLWSQLRRLRTLSLMCAYSMDNVYKEVRSADGGPLTPPPMTRVDHDAEARARALESEVGHRRRLEQALRDALHEGARVESELRHSQDELRRREATALEERRGYESLYRIGRSLNAELSLDKLVQILTDEGTALCGAEVGAFFYNVTDAKGEGYMLYALSGAPREAFAKFPMPRNTALFAPTFAGKKVVRVDDVRQDARYGKNPPYQGMPAGHLPVTSYLAVPVVSREGAVLGGLFFGHAQPARFTDRHEELLVAVAVQAASAIDNARLYEAERTARAAAEQAQNQAARLAAITAVLSRALSSDEAARVVIRETLSAVGAEAGAVLLVSEDGQTIDSFIVDGECDSPAIASLTSSLSLDAAQPSCEAARTGQLVWVAGAADLAARYPELVSYQQLTGAQTWGAIPLTFEGRTVGSLGFWCESERMLRPSDEQFLLAIGRQCAQAIERARLYEAMHAARARAESASRSKDEFLAMLGHELRNPLSPIVTALQLMKLRGDGGSTREQQIIERQVDHMVRLVDDLLDIAKITRGKVELDRRATELAPIVAKAVEIASPLLEQRGHHFHIAVPRAGMQLVADEVRLAQVIANLLTNAAKYTAPAGTIRLSARRDGEQLVVSVKDDGMGIEPELLPRIFDLFVQGRRETDRAQGGLGIGLALVRNLVTLHGGTVAALSAGKGHGSEFVVRLPAVRSLATHDDATREREPFVDPEPAALPLRILVVDDNEDAAALLAELLESKGHHVMVAYDGPRALALLERFVPDVAVLDIGLPVMDGHDLARRMREKLGDRCPRLMAVTGYGQEHDRRRSSAVGFERHFVKPLKAELLFAALDRRGA
jgi:signal transduction histidine kinase